ncbi:nuclear transport factor 2 family protein [Microbulbifer hainanensis]|uniref:nuclear transport factor 2 family protein n=1 Tax=Microbulbifer hainanensis TaxID=2735675 RepID=UPI0018663F39|nr:nuclear transport factor 2 family protein [Microbulbifer hainanensis]
MKSVVRITMAFGCILFSLQTFAKESPDSEEIKLLAANYVKAQFTFDQDSLAQITTPQFVEISPKGEVDERSAFLEFYAPEKKVMSPPYTITNVTVRENGSVAFISQVIGLALGSKNVEMTQGLSAVKTEQGWKLASSQTTPRPPKNKP